MGTIRPTIATLCAFTMIVPVAPAQDIYTGYGVTRPEINGRFRSFDRFTQKYKGDIVAPINLNNSNRLENLLRAGKLYLSVQDAIALALENNLDIEIQRYGPTIARADVLRSEAGGALRGVPLGITAGPSSAQNLVTGGAGQGFATGGRGGSGDTTGASTGSVLITQTGTAIPVYDESVFFNYQFNKTNQPNANPFTTGNTTQSNSTFTYSGGFSKNWASGTGITMNFNNNRIRSNVPNLVLNPFVSSNVDFQVTQRLLQGFGFALNTRNIRVARANVKVADLNFKAQVIATVQGVVNLYYDLVSFNADVAVKKQALALAERTYQDNKKQVEIGTLAPIEIVRAEAEVARTQQDLTGSETQVLQQETILKSYVSRNGTASPTIAEARIIPTDALKQPDVDPVTPIQDLISEALANRPEIEQTRMNIESAKIGLAGSRAALLPSLDFYAQGRGNGLIGSPNPLNPQLGVGSQFQVPAAYLGNYGNVLGQVFGFNYPVYTAGFQLTVPIRNRAAQADYVRDQVNLRQSELRAQQQVNNVRVDVQNALIGIQQAKARYGAALKSRQFQEQVLDAEQKKYALGSSTVFFVIQAQRDLSNAQGAEVQALNTYNRAKVQLDVALGRVLKEFSVELDEAQKGQVARQSTIPTVVDK